VIYIKTKKESDYIRESCKLVAETLQLLKSKVTPGISTFELDRIAEDYIKSNEAVPAFKGYKQGNTPGFPGSICTSVDEEVVHGIPGNRILKEGEIISLDVGVLKNNYYGDGALSIPVGKISQEKNRLMEVTEKSLYLGIEQAVEGNRVHDISAVSDEKSPVLKANVVNTCRKCHPSATPDFPDAWLSHYEPSPDKAASVYYVRLFYKFFIPFTIGGLVLHILLHLWRIAVNR